MKIKFRRSSGKRIIHLVVESGRPRPMPDSDQCRSIHTSADESRLMLFNTPQHRSISNFMNGPLKRIDQQWLVSMPRFWSALISIGHWSKGSCKVSHAKKTQQEGPMWTNVRTALIVQNQVQWNYLTSYNTRCILSHLNSPSQQEWNFQSCTDMFWYCLQQNLSTTTQSDKSHSPSLHC